MKYKCRFCSKLCEVKKKGNPRTATCERCRKINHRFRNRKDINHIFLTTWFVNQVQECVECGSHEELTIDRIIPASKGGKYEPGNLQILCHPCNSTRKCNFESIEDAIKLVKTRVCLGCGEEKPLTSRHFHKTGFKPKYRRNTLAEYHPRCKKCRSIRNK